RRSRFAAFLIQDGSAEKISRAGIEINRISITRRSGIFSAEPSWIKNGASARASAGQAVTKLAPGSHQAKATLAINRSNPEERISESGESQRRRNKINKTQSAKIR